MKFIQVVTENGRVMFINPDHVVSIHASGSFATIVLSDNTGTVVKSKAQDLAFLMAGAADHTVTNSAAVGKIG